VFLGVASVYETDQEQIEAMKGWWNQNGNWVIGGFLVFILTFVGYHWYQSATQNHRLEASAIYEELLVNITAEVVDTEQQADLVHTLKQDYSDLGYATFASLLHAKSAVESEDYEAALTELQWAEENSANELKSVIRYRIALVNYQVGELDIALAKLDAIEGEGHEAVTFELRGDVLLEQGNKADARIAYQTAVNASEEQGIDNPYLKIKLDDLAVAE